MSSPSAGSATRSALSSCASTRWTRAASSSGTAPTARTTPGRPTNLGRDLVFDEADLRHCRRISLLGELRAVLDHGNARGLLLATTSDERAEEIGA
jgi:hypothetical protein